jgi:hypothetical protein
MISANLDYARVETVSSSGGSRGVDRALECLSEGAGGEERSEEIGQHSFEPADEGAPSAVKRRGDSLLLDVAILDSTDDADHQKRVLLFV